MADINITINVPDDYVQRFSNVVDYIWGGRELEVPIPNKVEWVKKNIVDELKRKVLSAEKSMQSIPEIIINIS